MHNVLPPGADLLRLSLEELEAAFGKVGRDYYRIVRHEDHRPVTPHR